MKRGSKHNGSNRMKHGGKHGGNHTMTKILQKITALAVLFVFILSVVPGVLAESDNAVNEDAVNRDINIVNKDIDTVTINKEKFSQFKSEAKEKIAETKAELKEEIKTARKDFKQGHFKQEHSQLNRKVQYKDIKKDFEEAKEKFQKAKENFQLARKKFHEAKQKYKEHKKHIAALKEAVKDCREDIKEDIKGDSKEDSKEDSEECKLKRLKLRQGVIQHLEKTIDVISHSIEKLQKRVEEAKILSDSQKEESTVTLAKLQEDAALLRQQVTELSKDASAEEIKAVIKELKETWKEIRHEQKRIVASLTHSKLAVVVEKHDGLLNSMQKRIDHLAEQGADTSELEELREKFEELVTKLNQDYDLAKEQWQKVQAEETFGKKLDKKEALASWKEAQKEVRKGMEEARSILREFTVAFVKLKQSLDAEEKIEGFEEDEKEQEEESDIQQTPEDVTQEE